MRGRKTALRIDLTPEERTELERQVRCTTLPAGNEQLKLALPHFWYNRV